ncbi:hypothetical protein BGW38_002641 [Lunasporangiospora selenospora]|uniref:Uncharacterized protein n=1 Tax=Lunasporangiospora selenospora TaxID=979761 RepID=A0A9P6FSZ0_9FUNG|nr:hypothetical protein BGW38_002641 [Lunasporangiospora selenospora]
MSQQPAIPRPHTIHHTAATRQPEQQQQQQQQEETTQHDQALQNDQHDASQDSHSTRSPPVQDRSLRSHHPYRHLSTPHSLPRMERDALARSPSSLRGSPILNEGSSVPTSAGAALRLLLNSQGLGHGSERRPRSQPRYLSYRSNLYSSSGRGHGAPSAGSHGSSSSTNNPSLSDLSAFSSSPGSSGSGITPRRSSRRGETLERQGAIVIRPPSTYGSTYSDLSTSMENAPGSFGNTTPGSVPLPFPRPPSTSSLPSSPSTPSNLERRLSRINAALQQSPHQRHYDDEIRQHQLRNIYLQALQAREYYRLQAQSRLSGTDPRPSSSSENTQEQSRDQDLLPQTQQTFPPQDNGLLLVQPGRSSAPTDSSRWSASAGALEGSTGNVHRPSNAPLDDFPARLEERYQEFSRITERGRAALRNAFSEELYIEEDPHVLFTGEVSRRRRRRVAGQMSALEAGTTQIRTGAGAGAERSSESSAIADTRDQSASGTLDTNNPESSTESLARTRDDLEDDQSTSAETPLPGPTLATPDSFSNNIPTREDRSSGEHSGSSSSRRNSGDSREINPAQIGHDEGASSSHSGPDAHIPATPPSPNPNRNPMPTFQDRRRSSINPADVEAVVRQMEANVNSSVSRLGSSSSRVALTGTTADGVDGEGSDACTRQTTEPRRRYHFESVASGRARSSLSRTGLVEEDEDESALEQVESRIENQPPPLPSPPSTEHEHEHEHGRREHDQEEKVLGLGPNVSSGR